MTQNIFHLPIMNRRISIHASLPRGKGKRVQEARPLVEKTWAIVRDPSGTIRETVVNADGSVRTGALFGKMDVDATAQARCWAKGTIFLNIRSGIQYVYDNVDGKIRRKK